MIDIKKAEELYKVIAQKELLNIKTLEGWMVGMVFQIQTSNNENVVLKLYEKKDSTEESIDDRVYGSCHKNLESAHRLLCNKGISTFDLLSIGEIEKYTYAILTLLDGTEINQEIINQEVFVKTLANIHSINRKYQWWVSNKKEYELSWRDAFQKSIYSRLSDVKYLLDSDTIKKIWKYIDAYIKKLNNPDVYVLSHLDWLQAIFIKENTSRILSGVIDVEDYQFTDQRFVMAGITLCERLGRYKLPEDFFEIYQSKISLDSSFNKFEDLFQMYYLLVWIRVLNEYGNIEEEQRCREVLNEILENLLI